MSLENKLLDALHDKRERRRWQTCGTSTYSRTRSRDTSPRRACDRAIDLCSSEQSTGIRPIPTPEKVTSARGWQCHSPRTRAAHRGLGGGASARSPAVESSLSFPSSPLPSLGGGAMSSKDAWAMASGSRLYSTAKSVLGYEQRTSDSMEQGMARRVC